MASTSRGGKLTEFEIRVYVDGLPERNPRKIRHYRTTQAAQSAVACGAVFRRPQDPGVRRRKQPKTYQTAGPRCPDQLQPTDTPAEFLNLAGDGPNCAPSEPPLPNGQMRNSSGLERRARADPKSPAPADPDRFENKFVSYRPAGDF